jgi:hypothetical protein
MIREVLTERYKPNSFIQFKLKPAVKARAVAEAVIRRPVTAKDRVRSHASPREFYGGQMAVGQVFLWVVCFSSVSINSHTLRYLHVALTRTNERSLGSFQKGRVIHQSGSIWQKRMSDVAFKGLNQASTKYMSNYTCLKHPWVIIHVIKQAVTFSIKENNFTYQGSTPT